MRATCRALIALVLLATVVVAVPSATGAQEADYSWTFDPASPVAEPDPEPTFFVRANAGPIEACASFDATHSVTMNGEPLDSDMGIDAGGTVQVTFTPYTPGTYVVEATCTNGDDVARISGSIVVAPSSDSRQPTLTVTPAEVQVGRPVNALATWCTIALPGRTFNLIIDGPDGREVLSATADADRSAGVEYSPRVAGTYHFSGTCSAGDVVTYFVYPQTVTVTVTGPLGLEEDPRSPTPDPLRPATAAQSVTADPRFTG